MNDFRALPAVDRLLNSPEGSELVSQFGHALVVEAIRETLESIRDSFRLKQGKPPDPDILSRVSSTLNTWVRPTLVQVINATGVIIHTNLGRAPLSNAALRALMQVAEGYSTIEYNLENGKRGHRDTHIEGLLTRLTGAEAGLVVNNNAGAVLLILTALARRRSVLIARTQLVEVGGGFRIPDVMKQSGAKLVEIGTTNRVHMTDYESAIQSHPVALVLRAHRSNFRITGFTTEPGLEEIAGLAHKNGILVADDLGSGTLLETAKYGLEHEPTVKESLEEGADVVCFSGDKLLGGPQAGLIVGRREIIAKLRKHPLTRALRPDKLCLAALSATLIHYLVGEAESEIPVWRMISASVESIQRRVSAWADAIGEGEVIPGESTIGGGSLPGETLPTFLLAVRKTHPERLINSLRHAKIPIITRIQEDLVLLDGRTVLPEQDEMLVQILAEVLQ